MTVWRLSRVLLSAAVLTSLMTADFVAASSELPPPGGRDGAALSDRTTAPLERLRGPDYLQGPYARIQLRFPGLYRLTGAELAAGGVPLADVRPESLVLRHEGKIVPIRIRQNQPDKFSESDAIEFHGDYPRGDKHFYRPNNRYNVYMLTWSGPAAPAQARWKESQPPQDPAKPLHFLESLRVEADQQRYFIPDAYGKTDHFFISSIRPSPDPVELIRLGVPGFASDAGLPLRLIWALHGATAARKTTGSDYLLHFAWGEHDLGNHEFSGIREFVTSATVAPESVTSGGLRWRPLLVNTPVERVDDVSLSFLNWVVLEYPRRLNLAGSSRLRFRGNLLNPDGTTATLPTVARLDGAIAGTEVFNLSTGEYYYQPDKSGVARVPVRSADEEFVAVAPGPRLIVDSVLARPGLATANLPAVAAGLQQLILYHGVMEKAAKTLVRYRAVQGLVAQAVDAQDIQDAINHGFLDDGSMLKSYIRHVYDQAPGLKYLLLFSDSSNNHRDARPLPQLLQPEIMIPIHWVENRYVAWTAGFPDCNYYGALGASPTFPDIAVGRIPANSHSEAMEAVRKIIEYEASPRTTPSKAVFVSSVEQNFQDLVRQAETTMKSKFTSTTLLFPATAVADQEVNRMTEELSTGADLMYYLGHGGQYVWRVGPTDFQRQKDLFTPKQVRLLTNRGRYPIITCSSCYTTSFDGPEALGEVLVTAPRAGAVALIGTTWKSTVYEDHAFNMKLMGALMNSEKYRRLGDAFLVAKRATPPARPTDTDGHAFTLLGDPALLVRLTGEGQ